MNKKTLKIYAAVSFLMILAVPQTDNNLLTIAFYIVIFLNLYNAVRLTKIMLERDQELIKKAHLSNDWSEVADLKERAFSDDAKEIIGDRVKHLYRKEEWFAEQL